MAVSHNLKAKNAAVGDDRSRMAPGIFPKEFERSLWESLDKRFTIILLLTLLVESATIIFVVLNPPPREVSRDEISRIQKQFVRLVEQRKKEEKPNKFVETRPVIEKVPSAVSEDKIESSSPARRHAAGVETAEQRTAIRAEAAASRRRTRDQISSEIAGTGILGLLTSTSSSAIGAGVDDVLGDSKAITANLDEVLVNVGSIKRGSAAQSSRGLGSGGSDGDLHGGRASNSGSIEVLVEGLAQGVAKKVKRSGDLVISDAAPLIENQRGKSDGGRNQDGIAAVIMRHNSAIEYCYQKELRREPNLKGKLVIRFVITPQGTVESVTILSSTLNNPGMEACIADRIQRWNDFGAIDPSQGNTTVRQVYSFGY